LRPPSISKDEYWNTLRNRLKVIFEHEPDLLREFDSFYTPGTDKGTLSEQQNVEGGE
jgi:hypothetical protein